MQVIYDSRSSLVHRMSSFAFADSRGTIILPPAGESRGSGLQTINLLQGENSLKNVVKTKSVSLSPKKKAKRVTVSVELMLKLQFVVDGVDYIQGKIDEFEEVLEMIVEKMM